MKIFKGKTLLIIGAIVALLLVTPIALLVRPAKLSKTIDITEVDIENLDEVVSKIAAAINGKEFRNQKIVHVRFSEAEKLSIFKMLNQTAKFGLDRYGWRGTLSSRGKMLLWRQEKPLPVGVLPVMADFDIAIKAGKLELDIDKIKIGGISFPDFVLKQLSVTAAAEVNRDKGAAKILGLFQEAKFNTDGSMEILIDRKSAIYLIRQLMPR